MKLLALLLVGLGLLTAGSIGAYGYARDYDLYRGFPPPSEPSSIPHGKLVREHFYSPALRQRRSYLVYLPPGYHRAVAEGRRLPVLYLLQAPVGKARNYVQTGDLDVRVDELRHRGAIPPFLTVLPEAHSPLGTDHEWANGDQGPYEDFLLDAVHAVDARFPTVRNRSGRMLAGLSAGAYGATNVTLHHLTTFGSFESWSGYFIEDTKDAFHDVSPALLRANTPLYELGPRAAELRRHPVRAYLYQGRTDDEPVSQMLAFAAGLRADGSHVRSSVYGGKHDWALWRPHFSHMLVFAGHVLGRPR